MPALNVFEFAQRIKEYVAQDLGHNKWFIEKIIAVYSTRSKKTKYGYKVMPLFAGAIATDENGNGTHCRINFDDLCTLVDAPHQLPYISVSTTAKEHRAIFDEGVTVLHIECTKKGQHNGYPYVRHHTECLESTEKLTKLNESIIDKIQERLEQNNSDRAVKMEVQFHELLEESID